MQGCEMQGTAGTELTCPCCVPGVSRTSPHFLLTTTLDIHTSRPLYKEETGIREGLARVEILARGELSSDVVRPFLSYCFIQRRPRALTGVGVVR